MVKVKGQGHSVKNVIFQVYLIWMTWYRSVTWQNILAYDVMLWRHVTLQNDVMTLVDITEWRHDAK